MELPKLSGPGASRQLQTGQFVIEWYLHDLAVQAADVRDSSKRDAAQERVCSLRDPAALTDADLKKLWLSISVWAQAQADTITFDQSYKSFKACCLSMGASGLWATRLQSPSSRRDDSDTDSDSDYDPMAVDDAVPASQGTASAPPNESSADRHVRLSELYADIDESDSEAESADYDTDDAAERTKDVRPCPGITSADARTRDGSIAAWFEVGVDKAREELARLDPSDPLLTEVTQQHSCIGVIRSEQNNLNTGFLILLQEPQRSAAIASALSKLQARKSCTGKAPDPCDVLSEATSRATRQSQHSRAKATHAADTQQHAEATTDAAAEADQAAAAAETKAAAFCFRCKLCLGNTHGTAPCESCITFKRTYLRGSNKVSKL